MCSISRAPMPSEIRESDYVVAKQLNGGWLGLAGGAARHSVPGRAGHQSAGTASRNRKEGVGTAAGDPDDSLFCLFQALADTTLGYCATHALLCAVVCQLTARKLVMAQSHREALVNASPAHEHWHGARPGQPGPPELGAHRLAAPPDSGAPCAKASKSCKALVGRPWKCWTSCAGTMTLALPIRDCPHGAWPPHACHGGQLHVAKMAGRKTRVSMSPVKAVKSMVMGRRRHRAGRGIGHGAGGGFLSARHLCEACQR
jgi:hypothetical protein